MPLSHNQPFRVLNDAYGLVKGFYRMVLAERASDTVICILFRPEDPTHRRPGGRPIGIATKRPKQTPKKLTLPLFRGVLNPRFTRPFYAVPRTSVVHTAWD